MQQQQKRSRKLGLLKQSPLGLGDSPAPPASPCKPPKPCPSLSPIAGSPPEPYPEFALPTPEQCRAVRDDLLALHSFPAEFARYRAVRTGRRSRAESIIPSPPVESGPPREESSVPAGETVLDGLVATLLSQNTTDANSRKAFESLKSGFPTWAEVLAAESNSVENAIRCGGLAATKAACIKNILKSMAEKRGQLCLEYLRGMTVDEVKAELSCFKGIGPKTVACLLMFHLQRDDFPVDTHVFRIAKAIGWVPGKADRKKAYLHLNRRIPDDLKFDLNCLFVTHGKLCRSCSVRGGDLTGDPSVSCPLARYSC